MGMLDMKITQDMLNYWKKVIPTYQFAYYALDDSYEGTLFHPTVIIIGKYAFYNCSSLTTIILPAVITIKQYAFNNCANLLSVNLPAAINIGESAFQTCTNLTSITLPMVTSIGTRAFQGCPNLTSLTLQMAASIGLYAFSTCRKLTTVTLGSNLTSIANNTFQYCTALATINVMGDENCLTAQTLATLTPAQLNNATIVYNYTPPEGE